MFWDNIHDRKKILAIGAHPDDIELGAAGLLLFLKNVHDFELYYLVCSKGELGHSGKSRIKEMKKAAKEMGVKSVRCLGLRDGDITHDDSLVDQIEKAINFIKPHIVLSHAVNDHHQDHINVGRATISAVRYTSSTLIFYPSLSTRETFVGNLYVDITNFFDQKLKIISNFSSQKDNWYMDPSFIRAKAMEIGFTSNCKYAEKFEIHFLKLSA